MFQAVHLDSMVQIVPSHVQIVRMVAHVMAHLGCVCVYLGSLEACVIRVSKLLGEKNYCAQNSRISVLYIVLLAFVMYMYLM